MPSVPGIPKTLSDQTLQVPVAMLNEDRWKEQVIVGSPPSTEMAPVGRGLEGKKG